MTAVIRIYSHSSLGSFENCPRQYWYQYIGKPPVERVDTIEAFLGTRVHKTLEALYNLWLRGGVRGAVLTGPSPDLFHGYRELVPEERDA